MTKALRSHTPSVSVPALRVSFAVLASLVLVLAASPFACASQPEEETSCGPGTALANGQCIPVAQCGEGTTLVNGVCRVSSTGQAGASGTAAGGESGTTGGAGGQSGALVGGSSGAPSSSGSSGGAAGSSGSEQGGASGSQSTGGTAGAGMGGMAGSGSGDEPCPEEAPTFNCSDSCGPTSPGCEQETCNTCNGGVFNLQLNDPAAFPVIIRTKSVAGIEPGCATTCPTTAPGFTSPKHTMRVAVNKVQDGKTTRWFKITTTPTDAWVVNADNLSISCCLHAYVSNSCLAVHTKDPLVVQFFATKDDAPAQNFKIEMSNGELTCP